jgi:hypothetical protein
VYSSRPCGAFLVFLAGKAQMAGTSPAIHSFK